MTTALATLPSTELAQAPRGLMVSGDLRDQIVAVQRLREAVRTAPLAEAVEIAERARMAARWAKVAKSANELAVEAVKLECQALRRVGELDPSVFKGERRGVAEAFAAMSDREFAAVLTRAIPGTVSAVAILRSLRAEEREAWSAHRAWTAPDGYSNELSYRDVRDVLSAMLAEMDGDFDSADLAERLVEQMGMDLNDVNCEGIRQIANRVIRRAASEDLDFNEMRLPDYVTFHHDGQWRRVSICKATIPQLRAWATEKRKHADDVAAVAEDAEQALAFVVQLSERYGETEPDPGQIHNVIRKARAGRVLTIRKTEAA